MKSYFVRSSAIALVLIVTLSVAPIAVADQRPAERDFDKRVDRILKKLAKVIGGITTFSDIPVPPKP